MWPKLAQNEQFDFLYLFLEFLKHVSDRTSPKSALDNYDFVFELFEPSYQ